MAMFVLKQSVKPHGPLVSEPNARISFNFSLWYGTIVRRPSLLQLSLNLMHGFLSNFGCCLPWAIRSDFFSIFEKEIYFGFLALVVQPEIII